MASGNGGNLHTENIFQLLESSETVKDIRKIILENLHDASKYCKFYRVMTVLTSGSRFTLFGFTVEPEPELCLYHVTVWCKEWEIYHWITSCTIQEWLHFAYDVWSKLMFLKTIICATFLEFSKIFILTLKKVTCLLISLINLYI